MFLRDLITQLWINSLSLVYPIVNILWVIFMWVKVVFLLTWLYQSVSHMQMESVQNSIYYTENALYVFLFFKLLNGSLKPTDTTAPKSIMVTTNPNSDITPYFMPLHYYCYFQGQNKQVSIIITKWLDCCGTICIGGRRGNLIIWMVGFVCVFACLAALVLLGLIKNCSILGDGYEYFLSQSYLYFFGNSEISHHEKGGAEKTSTWTLLTKFYWLFY